MVTPKRPVRVLAAHGTHDADGQETVTALTAAVAQRLGEVRLAWLDVLSPDLESVLAQIAADQEQAVVVPALLSPGFHDRTDIPGVIARTAPDSVVAPVLGTDPRLVDALTDRLVEAGWRGEPVVLAATGSGRPEWHTVHDHVATELERRLGVPVTTGVASGPGRPVGTAIAHLQAAGFARVATSAYLLAEGFFWNRVNTAGASVTARPLGAHPAVVDLIAERFSTAT